jgi:squalene-hopene/tetraprenyl-beta-curcumene cyclase
MLSLTVLLTGLLVQGSPSPAEVDRDVATGSNRATETLRAGADKVAAKGVSFLEREGVAWTKTHKCSSCHHVPMMLWSQREAVQHGVKINESAQSEATIFALRAPYSGFFGPLKPEELAQQSGPSLELIYLALGLVPEQSDHSAAPRVSEFKEHILSKQGRDGSWAFTRKEKGTILAPIEDTDDVVTMLALLVFSQEVPTPEMETLKKSLDQALAWFKDSPPSESVASIALGLVIAQKFRISGRREESKKRLLRAQHEDGGWGQLEGRPSDALATGQALYALAQARIDASEAVKRALVFLERTQRADGSWLVPSGIPRNKGKDAIPSYFGSAWAVIGLVQHLSP